MKIFKLTEYCDDTYSFSGIGVNNEKFFISKELAEKEAEKSGLKVVEYCKNPNTDCTIVEEYVIEK